MIIYGMSEEEYHSQPELSSTQARWLLESPAHYRWNMDHPRADTNAFDIGSAVHAQVLGVGSPHIVIPDEHLTPRGTVSTKAETREWLAGARAGGMIPVSQQDADLIDRMTESVLAHPDARVFLEASSEREVSVFSTIDGVDVRCRFDALTDASPAGTRVGVDLKTTRKKADAGGFIRSVVDFGYDVQAGHYDATVEASEGQRLDGFVFIVVEKAPPFLTAVHRLDTVWMGMGRDKAREARRRLAEARASGVWPGYPAGVTELNPPAWQVIEFEEQYENYGEIRI